MNAFRKCKHAGSRGGASGGFEDESEWGGAVVYLDLSDVVDDVGKGSLHDFDVEEYVMEFVGSAHARAAKGCRGHFAAGGAAATATADTR